MRIVKLFVVVVALLLAACGGGTETSTEAASDGGEATTAADNESESSDDSDSQDSDSQDSDSQDSDSQDAGDQDDEDVISVSSFDDIPQVCRDLMSAFLKDIEPIVSPIDWDNATLADFDTISAEFEARADQFDADTEANQECDNLDLDDDGFDLMIEFAEDEAPGTVGFLGFIASFAEAAEEAFAEAGEGTNFTNCDEAIAFLEGLMETYDSMQEVPVSEMTAIAELATVLFSCTPDQMAFFESPEVNAFFDGAFG